VRLYCNIFISYVFFRRLLSLFSNIFLTTIEVGVNLKNGYNGDISAKDAGRIGGNMVKKMIQKAESQMLK
jgi:hypothetical protein